eukprot:scaffold375826_cov33-Prasinocladus_malaysianus.AAC.1
MQAATARSKDGRAVYPVPYRTQQRGKCQCGLEAFVGTTLIRLSKRITLSQMNHFAIPDKQKKFWSRAS